MSQPRVLAERLSRKNPDLYYYCLWFKVRLKKFFINCSLPLQENRGQAVFNHTEDYVLFPDEATTSLCSWDSRNASRQQLLSLGHNGLVRNIVHSPTEPAFLTCSDDFRARFWSKRKRWFRKYFREKSRNFLKKSSSFHRKSICQED